jgi:hypothetical protein
MLQDLTSIITILAIILAGVWTLYRFGIARERHPKLQFELHMHQLGTSRDKHIVEFAAVITNKGIARQYIRDFKFNILTFDDTMPFDLSDPKIEQRLRFHEMSKGLNWVNSNHPSFVDGGMSHQYTYVTALDNHVRFVMIYSKFDHESREWFNKDSEHYRIAKTFAVI